MCLASVADCSADEIRVGNTIHALDRILVGDDKSPVEMTDQERRFSNRIFFGINTRSAEVERFCSDKLASDMIDIIGSLNAKLIGLGATPRFRIFGMTVVFTEKTVEQVGNKRFR